MRYFLLLGALLSGAAFAADPAPTAEAPLVGGVDFISPMGEPVRSADQLSGAEHWFETVDANHDGRITRDEFRADARRFFDRLDSDHDGQIGPEEIAHYETVIAPEIQVASTGSTAMPSGDDSSSASTQPPYPDRLGAGRYGYIDLPEPIIAADLNFDRAIQRSEFDRAADKRFTLLDSNGDGAITRSELPKLKAVSDDSGDRRGKRRRR